MANTPLDTGKQARSELVKRIARDFVAAGGSPGAIEVFLSGLAEMGYDIVRPGDVKITDDMVSAGCDELDVFVAQDIVDGITIRQEVVVAIYRAMFLARQPVDCQ